MQRQLAPPKEMVVATKADKDAFMEETGDLLLESRLRKERDSLKRPRAKNFAPVPGKRLNPIMVAKRLMNQKLTSVADVAAVLTRHQKLDTNVGRVLSPKEKLEAEERAREIRVANRSERYQKRLEQIREEEKKIADRVKSRESIFKGPGGNPLSPHARQRIYAEHGGPALRNIVQSDAATAKENGGIMSKEERLDYLAAEEESAVGEVVERLVAQIDRQHADNKENAELAYEAELSSKIVQLNASHTDKAPVKVVLQSGREVHFVAQYAKLASLIQKARHDIHSQYGQKRKALLEAYRNGTLEPLPQEILHSEELEPSTHAVTVSWASLGDKFYAPSWPDSVTHTTLDAASISQSANGRWSANPHILGVDKPSTPEDFDHLINYAYPSTVDERQLSRERALERAYEETELRACQDILNLRQQLTRRFAEILEPGTSKTHRTVETQKAIVVVPTGTAEEPVFTLLDQDKLHVLRRSLPAAQYSFTNTILDELENACSNLQASRLRYGLEDSKLDDETSSQARVHADYIRKNLHYAEPEFVSTPQLLDRLAYIRDATDLVITELERPRGRHLADMRTTFDSIIAARSSAVSRLANLPAEEEMLTRKAAAEAIARADVGSDELDALNKQLSERQRLEKIVSDIDEQHPFATDLLRRQEQRREEVVNLQNEINELTETIKADEAERDQLEARFVAEHKEVAKKPSAEQKDDNSTKTDTSPAVTESVSPSAATADTTLATKTNQTKLEITRLRFTAVNNKLKDEQARLSNLHRQQRRLTSLSVREEHWQTLAKQNNLGSRTFVDRAVEIALQKRQRAGDDGNGNGNENDDDDKSTRRESQQQKEGEKEEVVLPDRNRGFMGKIPILGRFVGR